VLPSEGVGTVVVSASDLSALEISGASEKVTLTDTLPAGLEVLENSGGQPEITGVAGAFHRGGPVECSSAMVAGAAVVSCGFEGTLQPYELIEVRIRVRVGAGAVSGAPNRMSVSGGGAASLSVSQPVAIGSAATAFGVEQFEFTPETADGSPATQAGAHPFQLTTTVFLDSGAETEANGPVPPPALVKDLRLKLPPGLVANPTAFPECTAAQFGTARAGVGGCSTDSQIGVARVTFYDNTVGTEAVAAPLFNLVPGRGEPARFGFYAYIFPVVLDTSVRTGGDYGITVTTHNATEEPVLLAAQVTVWGDPGDPRHDDARGSDCLGIGRRPGACTSPEDSVDAPFLTMPTTCGNPLSEPLESSLSVDSWADPSLQTAPAVYRWHDSSGTPLALDGCDKLDFEPSVGVVPDLREASSPSGLSVDQHIPQEASVDPNLDSVAQSDVKDVTATLPEGVVLNPAGADGLEACSEGQVGFTGVERGGVERDLFTAGLPEPFCPDASKIGTVRIKTPILPNPLEGAIYLAAQDANPFSSLIAMYLVAEDPVSGVLLKVPGSVSLSPQTGRITATFEDIPQAPFEEAELHFFGGERAPLATPAHCGSYTTNLLFTPWSGGAPVNATSTFDVTSGPNGGPCPGAVLPFAPTLTAGTTSNQAGGFSPFTMTMSREDGQQSLKSVSLRMPPGLLGTLTGIPLCGESEADAGTCGAGSLVGETTISVGLGGDPFSVTGGKVYLTGPYEGAPFGLSIVNPAKAGPFDLENTSTNHPPCDCIVVRAKLELDRTTAAVIVTSDSSGPYAIPPSIEGIPLEIKHVNVTIDRAGGFTFNPTSCDPLQLTGTLGSIEGATASLAVPFQATNCAALKFTPKFTVSTSGKTSKANGAGLTVKVTRPSGPGSDQANFAKVKVDLPKQLPSRLTTLQKACTAAQFEANPAGCPAASVVGHVKVLTPLLPVPVEGPAYFVSHGGEAFPSLIFVLQGYGVTIDVVSSTFISKSGITSATLKAVPDVPFTSFELTFPEGPHSALAANLPTKAHGSFCGQKLTMPTAFVAQNGDEVHQSTAVGVIGCKSVKKTKKGHHEAKKRKHS
jgi:hypothetical protein